MHGDLSVTKLRNIPAMPLEEGGHKSGPAFQGGCQKLKRSQHSLLPRRFTAGGALTVGLCQFTAVFCHLCPSIWKWLRREGVKLGPFLQQQQVFA